MPNATISPQEYAADVTVNPVSQYIYNGIYLKRDFSRYMYV